MTGVLTGTSATGGKALQVSIEVLISDGGQITGTVAGQTSSSNSNNGSNSTSGASTF